MKKIMIALISVILLIASIAVFSQGRGQGMRGGGHGAYGPMGGWFNESVLQEAGVSDAVRKQIREITYQTRKDMMENQHLIREKRLALHQEYFKKDLNEEKINALHQQIWEMQKNQVQKIEKSKLAIAKLLTPAQREALAKLTLQKKREFWGKMRYMDY